MARKLTDLLIDRVDLCKLGANYDLKTGDGAHILLMKHANVGKTLMECPSCGASLGMMYTRDGSEIPNYCPTCGAKLTLKASGGASVSKASHLHQPSSSGTVNAETGSTSSDEGTMTPEQQQQAMQKAIDEAVAKAVATATAPLVAENAALKKAVDDQKQAADAAQAIAKAERDTRLTNETRQQLGVYKHLSLKLDGDGNDVTLFKTLIEKVPESVTRLHEILKAADALLASSKVSPFRTVGKTGDNAADDDSDGSAYAEIEKAAKQLVTDGKVKTVAEGVAMVHKTQPDLVAKYEAEFQARQKRAK